MAKRSRVPGTRNIKLAGVSPAIEGVVSSAM